MQTLFNTYRELINSSKEFSMTQHDKIKQILDTLNNLQENLLSLPDDMLLSIDPRDNESLEQGTQFIKAYNNSLSQFTDSSAKIAQMVKAHFGINPEEDDVVKESGNRQQRERLIAELLYLLVLNMLQATDPAKFAALPETERFISNRGKPLLSSNEHDLRLGEKLDSGLYAEINLSANALLKYIKELLEHFGLDPRSMKIYLREDRDADK